MKEFVKRLPKGSMLLGSEEGLISQNGLATNVPFSIICYTLFSLVYYFMHISFEHVALYFCFLIITFGPLTIR